MWPSRSMGFVANLLGHLSIETEREIRWIAWRHKFSRSFSLSLKDFSVISLVSIRVGRRSCYFFQLIVRVRRSAISASLFSCSSMYCTWNPISTPLKHCFVRALTCALECSVYKIYPLPLPGLTHLNVLAEPVALFLFCLPHVILSKPEALPNRCTICSGCFITDIFSYLILGI